MKDIENTLWKAAKDSGWSIMELSRQSGLAYSAMHGFIRDRRAITLRSAARIAKVLQLELKPAKRKGR